mgnify:CR=1 FL=1
MPKYSKEFSVPGKSADEIYAKVSDGIDHFLNKLSLKNYEINRDENSKEVSIDSKMFSAKLICSDDSIHLDARLSLLAAPFRSKIDEGIGRWLSKTF